MKSFLFAVITFLTLNTARSQTSISNDTIHWDSARPLTWEDFKGEAIEGVNLFFLLPVIEANPCAQSQTCHSGFHLLR